MIRGRLLTILCAIGLMLGGYASGNALEGVLEVRSAYVNIDKGVFLLYARVEYPESPAIRDALRDGITLTFDLQARVDRDRRFWFNAGIVDLTLRRELTYHAVSDRYVVRDTKSGDQTTYATLDEALQLAHDLILLTPESPKPSVPAASTSTRTSPSSRRKLDTIPESGNQAASRRAFSA